MKVLVCGGREFSDKDGLYRVLDLWHSREPFTLVIHGAASGADSLAQKWAWERDIPHDPHPALWDDLRHKDAIIKTNRRGQKYDARAGFRRNEEMARLKPDLVLAFPGGEGTADMVRRAKAHDLKVEEV